MNVCELRERIATVNMGQVQPCGAIAIAGAVPDSALKYVAASGIEVGRKAIRYCRQVHVVRRLVGAAGITGTARESRGCQSRRPSRASVRALKKTSMDFIEWSNRVEVYVPRIHLVAAGTNRERPAI